MSRAHAPSAQSKATHAYSMAQAPAVGPLLRTRTAHRCPQCQFWHQHGQAQCQVCQTKVPVLHIDAHMAEMIYTQRRTRLGQIAVNAGMDATNIPDHSTPQRALMATGASL